MWANWGRRSARAILKPGCTLQAPGHHFKYTGARVANQDQCPCECSLKFLVPCEGITAHSYSHVLWGSLSYTHAHRHTHARMHTHTHALSWLLHTASSREHSFTWQQLRPPAASGLEPNCTEERGRSKGRLFSPAHPTSFPPNSDLYQGETRTQSFEQTPSLFLPETKGFRRNQ